MFHKKTSKKAAAEHVYDRENERPVIRCSICTGEQVAGFKNIHTGKFAEVMLIKNGNDLAYFKEMYGLSEVTKEY